MSGVDTSEYYLRIGDYICLYSEDGQGFLYNDDSSIKNNGLKVYSGPTARDADSGPSMNTVTFQVFAPNRYKLIKHYHKLKDALKDDKESSSALEQAKIAADDETEDNKTEQSRLLGNKVRYGDIIQLCHQYTNKFVLVTTKEGSRLEHNKMRVVLKESNSKSAQFRILPRYKVKVEGEVVELEDPVVFESVKSPSNYLHTCQRNLSTEVNCGTDLSVYVTYKHYSPIQPNLIRGGSVIQPFHKDMEGYMSAEGMFGGGITENAHLRVRPMDPDNIRSFYPPNNTSTFWQIVLDESPIAGSELKWDTNFHLLHMTTRRFLCFTEEGEVLLVNASSDDTLFQLVPLYHSSKSENIPYDTTVRIVHTKTRRWMHTSKDFPYQKHDYGNTGSLEAIQWDKTELLQLRISSGRDFPDAFILQKVEDQTMAHYNYVTGLFPFLRELIYAKENGEFNNLPAKEISKIDQTFKELKEFTRSGDTNLKVSKQNMLRQTKMIDVLVDILHLPLDGTSNSRMLEIFKYIYEVIYSVTSVRLTANLLYCGRFLTFFQTQLLCPRGVGLQCCFTVIELIKDNRKVIDRIQPEHVNMFIDLLLQHKLHHFLDLLGALCICNGVALTENQTLIAENLLSTNKNHLYMLQTGKEQKATRESIFISTDLGKNWTQLQHFVDASSPDYSTEQYTYLLKQLDLYMKLCFGGNPIAVDLVQNNQGVFNWDVALLGLQSKYLPDDLRTKICDVVTGIYLESGKNMETVAEVSNNFKFRSIERNSLEEIGYVSTSLLDGKFPGLREWLKQFLKDNPVLDPKNVDRNRFIAHVVHLVTGLAKYGYVQDSSELETFRNLIMNYIKAMSGSVNALTFQRSNHLTKRKPVVTSSGNASVHEAIIECTDFLDVIFTIQTTRRIQILITEFKEAVSFDDKVGSCFHISSRFALADFMREISDDKIWESRSLQKRMKDLIDYMCRTVDLVGKGTVDTFYKLSLLGNDMLRSKAFLLMARCFSAKTEFLETAMRAKLIISADSERVYHLCSNGMPDLRMVANSKITEEDLSLLSDILHRFKGSCHAAGKEDHTQHMRQNIFVNSGILEVIMKLITMDVDKELHSMAMIEESSTRMSLELLQALAQGNKYVQDWIFEHLNSFLFEVTTCGFQCSSVLVEVFKERPELCEKILPRQISKVTSIIGKYQEEAPEFVKLLKIWIEDEHTGMLHTRNQQHVIKSLMDNYSQAGYPFIKTENERLGILLGSDGHKHQSYYINLIDVMAASAQGKNDYIHSVCQTLLSIGEVLRVLGNNDVDLANKIQFAKFLERVYLNTTRTSLESGTEDLSHDKDMWKIIDVITLLPSVTSPLSTIEKAGKSDDVPQMFMFQAGFKVLIGFFANFYEPDVKNNPEEQDALISLEANLEDFCVASAGSVSGTEQIDMMSSCLQLLRTHIGTTPQQQKLYEKTFVKKTFEKNKKALKERENCKQREEVVVGQEYEINHQFHTFSKNLHKFALGQNTVGYQCQLKDRYLLQKVYLPESDTPIPQGLEFQEFVQFFVGHQSLPPVQQLQRTTMIIEQLHTSYLLNPKKAPYQQEKLDILGIQLLRALLHNEIVKLPHNWEDQNEKWRLVLLRIKKIQTVLDGFEVIPKVLPLMARSNPQVGKQILQLLQLLLFNANREIQESTYRYFNHTREEAFFFFIKETIDHSIPGIKERRFIEEKHLILKQKEIRRTMLKKKKLNLEISRIDENSATVANSDVHSILNVLSGLCDGQNRLMQDYMRSQPDNLRSINVLAKITDFISVLYAGISPNTIDLCTHLFTTLHEVCEGNSENKDTLLNYKIVEYLNMVLRTLNLHGCSMKQVTQLRKVIGELLYSMVEEYGNQSAAAQSISQTISVEHIIYIMTLCYVASTYNVSVTIFTEGKSMTQLADLCAKTKFDVKYGCQGIRETLSDIGFLYYTVLATLFVIDKTLAANMFTCDLEEKAFLHFKKHCKTIEIVHDGTIQVKHFEFKHESLLREEVKEVVKWGIDRSSSTSKLLGLLIYSSDIVSDVNYQRKLHKNWFLTKLAQKWTLWNYACIIISLIINIFMLVTWKAVAVADDLPQNLTLLPRHSDVYDPRPEIRFVSDVQYDIVLFTLGGLHIFSSLMLFACYILLYHPTLPGWMNTSKKKGEDTKQSIFKKGQKSKLEIKLLSSTTMYYVIFLAFSVLGLVYQGYFFAFHLLGIIDNNQLLKGVIRAVTLNGRSLIWVAVLGVIILYIYALVGFAAFRPGFNLENLLYCNTLAECFISILRYGTIGDISQNLRNSPLDTSFTEFVYMSIYHLTFFVIFTTIGLNIIFGIIVDTFSEIRDKKWVAEKDMMEYCFICNREKREFEHFGKGFNHHVHDEHNMWAYVFYFVHLEDKEQKDYTALDMHVAVSVKKFTLDFFPLNQAISLAKADDVTDKEEPPLLLTDISRLEMKLSKQALVLKHLMEIVNKIEVNTSNLNDDDEGKSTNPSRSNSKEVISRQMSVNEEKGRRLAIMSRRNLSVERDRRQSMLLFRQKPAKSLSDIDKQTQEAVPSISAILLEVDQITPSSSQHIDSSEFSSQDSEREVSGNEEHDDIEEQASDVNG